jgi:hypothetical protein
MVPGRIGQRRIASLPGSPSYCIDGRSDLLCISVIMRMWRSLFRAPYRRETW